MSGRAAHQTSVSVWWTADHVSVSVRVTPEGDFSRSQSVQAASIDVETKGIPPRTILRRSLEIAMEALDELPVTDLA